MKALLSNGMTVEGTPTEIRTFMDLLEWGPHLPKKPAPFKPYGLPYISTTLPLGGQVPMASGDPPTSGTRPFYAGSGINFRYDDKSE